MIEYILLFRHGAVKRNHFELDRDQELAPEGYKDGYDVAKALVDTILVQPGKRQIKVGCIWHASSNHVKQAANILLKTFQKNGLFLDAIKVVEEEDLSPAKFWPEKGTKTTKKFVNKVLNLKLEQDNALIIVGHQPQLGWIGSELLKQPLPISRSEIVCIARDSNFFNHGPAWHLLWTISPLDEKTLAELKEKIKSKMDVAKTLGSFILAVLALALNSLLDPNRVKELLEINGFETNGKVENCFPLIEGCFPLYAVYLATASFFLSSILYLATVYAYDRLLMPSRFWGEIEKKRGTTWLVERPPSSNVWILYQNMMRVWNRLFNPATYSVVFGLICLCYAAFQPKSLLYFVVVVIVAIIIFNLYYKHSRPRLGTED